MPSISVNVTVPPALIAALEKAKRLDGVKRGLVQAGGYLVGMEANYPPESHRPQPFKTDKQRRAFFAMLKAGIIRVPYQRTGLTQRSMQLSIENGGLTVRTGTNLDRVKWTHGEKQAVYHSITGWRKMSAIADREAANAVSLVEMAARSDFE